MTRLTLRRRSVRKERQELLCWADTIGPGNPKQDTPLIYPVLCSPCLVCINTQSALRSEHLLLVILMSPSTISSSAGSVKSSSTQSQTKCAVSRMGHWAKVAKTDMKALEDAAPRAGSPCQPLPSHVPSDSCAPLYLRYSPFHSVYERPLPGVGCWKADLRSGQPMTVVGSRHG